MISTWKYISGNKFNCTSVSVYSPLGAQVPCENEVSVSQPQQPTQGTYYFSGAVSQDKCEALRWLLLALGWWLWSPGKNQLCWLPGEGLRANPRASRKGKSGLSPLAVAFDRRGAAADPREAVITCTPNMKQGNQLTK